MFSPGDPEGDRLCFPPVTRKVTFCGWPGTLAFVGLYPISSPFVSLRLVELLSSMGSQLVSDLEILELRFPRIFSVSLWSALLQGPPYVLQLCVGYSHSQGYRAPGTHNSRRLLF